MVWTTTPPACCRAAHFTLVGRLLDTIATPVQGHLSSRVVPSVVNRLQVAETFMWNHDLRQAYPKLSTL